MSIFALCLNFPIYFHSLLLYNISKFIFTSGIIQARIYPHTGMETLHSVSATWYFLLIGLYFIQILFHFYSHIPNSLLQIISNIISSIPFDRFQGYIKDNFTPLHWHFFDLTIRAFTNIDLTALGITWGLYCILSSLINNVSDATQYTILPQSKQQI